MTKRIFIYPKDLAILTGKQYQACLYLWKSILAAYSKDKKQGLTIKEYCRYTGADEETVLASIQ